MEEGRYATVCPENASTFDAQSEFNYGGANPGRQDNDDDDELANCDTVSFSLVPDNFFDREGDFPEDAEQAALKRIEIGRLKKGGKEKNNLSRPWENPDEKYSDSGSSDDVSTMKNKKKLFQIF